jgi:predicted alpha/beta-fold hydrolase
VAEFKPPLTLRSPHTQSILNSSSLRRRFVARSASPLLAAEQELLMDAGPPDAGLQATGERVRLLAHYSPQPGPSAGTVVLLHGWEGSSRSNYMLATGQRLFDAGFNVFRLNFRDHGPSHQLNPGIFHSCRLDEVIAALGDMQRRLQLENWGIAGFSLGGNFALRVALHGPARGLKISRVFAVCPVLDPAHTLVAMEAAPRTYERYYIDKWSRSVRAKQACFPERYEYDEWYTLGGLRERTEFFATRYYEFGSLRDYLDGYAIAGDRLQSLSVPGTLLTSEDDPVIPASDAHELPDIPGLDVRITRYGGHCGYLKSWKLNSWADEQILAEFRGQSKNQGPESRL